MKEREQLPNSRADDVEIEIVDISDRVSPHHKAPLVLAQLSLAEGDTEEAIVLAEESACMDKFESE